MGSCLSNLLHRERVQAFGFWDSSQFGFTWTSAILHGTQTKLAVISQGTALTYEWYHNGVHVSDTQVPSFTINNVGPNDAGIYTVTVLNTRGSASSSWAYVGVLQPPAITTQPQDKFADAGQSVTFNVVATGTVPLYYQWYRDGWQITAATTDSSLAINPVDYSDDGAVFNVLVWNDVSPSGVLSSDATLHVTPATPATITTQPQSQTVLVGANATFTVTATGSAPLTYQWYFNGNAISGATSSSFTINNAQNPNAGTYSVVVQNPAGSVTSDDATLGVAQAIAPVILSQPASRTVIVGSDVTFKVSVLSAPPTTFQWKRNGSTIAGATTSSLLVQNVLPSANGDVYSVLIQNYYGSTPSANATLTVETVPLPPVVISPSHSDTLPATVTLSVPGYPDATIYYTLDGTTPTTGSSQYSSPLTVSSRKVVSAFATKQYYLTSGFTSTIIGDPHAPTAVEDTFVVQQDDPVTSLDIVGGDTDLDGDSLTITAATQPYNGTVDFTSGTSYLTYQPNLGFFGIDAFSYTISDGNGNSASATATVFVNKANNVAPTVDVAPSILGIAATTVSVDIRSGSTDADGDDVSVYSLGLPVIGSANINAGKGSVTYSRQSGVLGNDGFRCTATDGNGGLATTTVFVANLDFDGDGMPDEWESAHGLNPLDATDANLDPDGDGLSNYQEYQLLRDPYQSDSPVHVALDGTGVLSGNHQISITVDSGYAIDNLTILTEGGIFPGTVPVVPQGNQPYQFTVNTAMLANGTHDIAVSADLRCNPAHGIDIANSQIASAPINIAVFNEIAFAELVDSTGAQIQESWRPVFGDTALNILASAQKQGSSTRDAITYQIKIYSDPNASPIKTINGSSSDGLINEEWDLVDDSQQPQYEPNFTSQITVAWNADPTHTANAQTPGSVKQSSAWPDSVASWVVAYQDVLYANPQNQVYAIMDDTAKKLDYDFAQYSSDKGRPLPTPPDRQMLEAYHIGYQSTPGSDPEKQKVRNNQFAVLKAVLKNFDTRNFWFLAHGTPYSMGGDWDADSQGSATDRGHGSTAEIKADDIAKLLGNNTGWVFQNGNFKSAAPQHPYRFVFLDGCKSAASTSIGPSVNAALWPLAFGIEPVPHPLSWYKNSSGGWNLRPSAFCGWSIGVPLLGSFTARGPWFVIPEAVQFRILLMSYWQTDLWDSHRGKPLGDASSMAWDAFDPAKPAVQGVNKSQRFVDDFKSSWIITGCKDINFYQYNQLDIGDDFPPN